MADLGFEGRVAVVTGAGGGLGRAHALLLADRGARVLVNDVGGAVDGSAPGDFGPAQHAVEAIEALGGEAVANTDSVATPAGGEAIIRTAIEAFGRVDIVVNNAGVLRDKTFQNMTADLLDPVIDVHLKGAFHVTRPAWAHMREQGYGRIVSTTSGSGLFGNFGQSNYAAAKLGLVGLTRVLANEGVKHGIRANAIAPVAATRMTQNLGPDLAEALRPELVSPLVAWLAHEDCPVSGEIYSVAGGYVARVFIAVTPGVVLDDPTPESIRDAFDEIRSEDGYIVPSKPFDEMERVMPRLAGGSA